MGLLEMQLVLVSGGRDKRGGPTITVPASAISREKARPEDYSKLLHYLTLVPRFASKSLVFSGSGQSDGARGQSNRFEGSFVSPPPQTQSFTRRREEYKF